MGSWWSMQCRPQREAELVRFWMGCLGSWVSLCPHVAERERERELKFSSSCKGTNPIMGAPSS